MAAKRRKSKRGRRKSRTEKKASTRIIRAQIRYLKAISTNPNGPMGAQEKRAYAAYLKARKAAE